MPQAPQHPGRAQQAQQQGGNPYYSPNSALTAANTELANAQAAKASQEAQILQSQGLGAPAPQQVQPGAEVTPQQVQAGQIADAIIKGQLDPRELEGAIQRGEVDPSVAEAGYGMAQQFMQQDQQRLEQAQGLGAI